VAVKSISCRGAEHVIYIEFVDQLSDCELDKKESASELT
jgi:hypothetical protein